MVDFRNTIKTVANLSPSKLQSSNKDKQHSPYYGRKKVTKAKDETAETQTRPHEERRSGQDRRHRQGSRGPWLESRQGDRRRQPKFEIKA